MLKHSLSYQKSNRELEVFVNIFAKEYCILDLGYK